MNIPDSHIMNNASSFLLELNSMFSGLLGLLNTKKVCHEPLERECNNDSWCLA